MDVVEAKDRRNIVFIGNKPPMNYVLAVITLFNEGVSPIVVRARGKAISRAVDVAEVVRNKFMQDCTVDRVDIGTEKVVQENGRRAINVSTIEIHLGKQA